MTSYVLPDAPPSRKGVRVTAMADLSSSLMFADRRRRYSVHVARVMRRDEEGFRGIAPVVRTDGRRIEVSVPGAYSNAPRDVLCELVCHAMRRTEDPSLPLFGPTVMAYFRSGVFVRYRLWAMGEICDPRIKERLANRRTLPPFRIVRMFYAWMEDRLPFLSALMQVRRMRFVPMTAENRHAAYAEPYLGVVFYDRAVLDPKVRPVSCMAVLFRSCAFIACFDRRTCRLDESRFLLMLSMCPWMDEGMASCRRDGVSV